MKLRDNRNFLKQGRKNPLEVRNVLPTGASEFLRPMPGAARMYPETDLPLLKISRDLINKAKKNLPKLRSEVEEELKKEGLSYEMIKVLFKQNKVEEYKQLLKILNNPSLVSKVLLIFPKEIATRNKLSLEKVEERLEDNFTGVLKVVKKGKIDEGDIKHVLEKIVSGDSLEEAIELEKVDHGEVEEQVMKIIQGKPGLSSNAYMGLIMKDLKGRIDGKTAMEMIQKFTK